MEARKSEAGELRQVLVCVGEHADELQALFAWATSCFFEPRDVVSIMYARFDTAQLMVRRELRLPSARCAHFCDRLIKSLCPASLRPALACCIPRRRTGFRARLLPS